MVKLYHTDQADQDEENSYTKCFHVAKKQTILEDFSPPPESKIPYNWGYPNNSRPLNTH